MTTKNDNLDEVFKTAYSKLNKGQKQAVDTIEGPVMVIAGPGTGKTQILTLRIANILRETDTKPEQILALTFTDSGAQAMRARLATFIGADAYRVPIHTFHSFAGELIRNYPDSYKNIVGGRPAKDFEKIRLVEELLNDGEYKILRPSGDPKYYVRPVLDAIATLKKEDISSGKLAEFIAEQERQLEEVEKFHTKGAHKGKVKGDYLKAEKYILRNRELLSLYQHYLALMKEKRLYDFEDMILDTIKALENSEDMLLDVQEQYQYLLADEHQDVNQSQNHLIELISSYHERPNVFVVGDEKQAIYRFQGASLENFLYFEDRYKEAVTISLVENYRSSQEILDLAHTSIMTDDENLKKLRVPLQAFNTFDTVISCQEFSHTAIEDEWVVDKIKKHQTANIPLSQMAIIVRTNREVEQFATLLRKAEIPVAPSADGDILHHPIINNIKTLIKAVIKPDEETALVELLHAPYLDIEVYDLVTLLRARSFEKPITKILGDIEILKEIGVENPEALLKVNELLKTAADKTATKTPVQVLEYILRESGFIDYVMKVDPLEGSRVVRRLYDEVEAMFLEGEVKSLVSVLDHLDLCEAYNLPLNAPFIATATEAVQVMTAHKAKGLEFEVVMIPHLTDNVWGAKLKSSLFLLPLTKRALETKELAEDDGQRLFYVSLTRAKRVLECSYSLSNIEGKGLTQSRFLTALENENMSSTDVTDYENKFNPVDIVSPITSKKIDLDFLRTALLQNGWSATSFNNYMQSPWQYIYKNVLRFPAIKTSALYFGTAIHAVLDLVVKRQFAGESVSDSDINELLKRSLSKAPLSTPEFSRLHQKGLEALMAYVPKVKDSLLNSAKTEYSVQAVLPTGLPEFPEVILKGNFDRLDFDKDGNVVRVVDYKTGKPKTKGQIEGKTKNSDGAYKRQLVFYALLLSMNSDERFHTRNGVLSFVEPDSKGVIHEEPFTITDEEIIELREQIIEATKMVVTGKCLTEICDPNKCEFCHLVEVFSR